MLGANIETRRTINKIILSVFARFICFSLSFLSILFQIFFLRVTQNSTKIFMDTIVIESHLQHFTVDRIIRLVQSPCGRALGMTRTKNRTSNGKKLGLVEMKEAEEGRGGGAEQRFCFNNIVTVHCVYVNNKIAFNLHSSHSL